MAKTGADSAVRLPAGRVHQLLVLESSPNIRAIREVMGNDPVSILGALDFRSALNVLSNESIDAAIIPLDSDEGLRAGTYFNRIASAHSGPRNPGTKPYIFTSGRENSIGPRDVAAQLNGWGFHHIPRELDQISATIRNALEGIRTPFPKGSILVVGSSCSPLSTFFAQQGFHVETAIDAETSADIIASKPPDALVITEHNFSGKMNGLELLTYVRERWPSIFVGYMALDDKNLLSRYFQQKIDDILPRQPGPTDLDQFYRHMRNSHVQEGLFQRAFNVGEPSHIMGTTGLVTFCNKASEALFGYKTDGVTIQNLITDADAVLRGLERSSPSTITTKAIHCNGREIPVSLEIKPLPEGHQYFITYHILSETEATHPSVPVYRPADLFAAGVAHDIKTFVAVMSGYAEDVRLDIETPDPSHPLDPVKAAEKLGIIMKTATICSQLLDGYRIFTRNGSVWNGPLDLEKTISDLGPFAVPLHRNKKAKLEFHLESCPPINSNYATIQTILLNLIKNAGEALDDNPGTITVATRSDGINVYISVSDTGSGIPEDVRPNLFSQLFTTKNKGSGLGLYNSRELARRCGGTLEVDPTYFPGARFILTFPAYKNEIMKSGEITN